MSQAVQTLEGWYVLHDFRSIDWNAWKALTQEERDQATNELLSLMSSWNEVEAEKKRQL